MRHIISILMENEPGALSRLIGLFSQRNYNIETLNVAPTQNDELSRLTLTTYGNDETIEQIVKHLNKQINIIRVVDLTENHCLERELMLVKLKAKGELREEIKRNVDIFRAQIINVTPTTYTIQITGNQSKIDAFLQVIGSQNVIELARSGVCGLARGENGLAP